MTEKIMTLLSDAINGKKTDVCITENELIEIYSILDKQDLAHLVGYLFQESQILPDNEIGKKFADSVFKAIFRFERNNHELKRIISAFEKTEIPFIPMKGAVIKDLYPLPWLRTTSDIDILIKKEDIKRASDILSEQLSFQSTAYGTHDVSFENSAKVHLELHYCLVETEEFPEIAAVTDKVWENAYLVTGSSYQYAMSDEMFYFYNIAHMYKHFKYGGCGIKTFLDTYVILKKLPENKEKRDALLGKGGILKFNKEVIKACKVWFEGATPDETTDLILKYTLKGGLYGNITNKAAMNKITNRKNSKTVFQKLWKPYDELKYWYPNLEKHKILFPFYQVKRWLFLVSDGIVEGAINEKNETKKINGSEIADVKELFNILDIK